MAHEIRLPKYSTVTSSVISYTPIDRTTITTGDGINVMAGVPANGDFIVQFEYYGENELGFTGLTSTTIKDLGAGVVSDTGNINLTHVIVPIITPLQIINNTYTHTALVRGLSTGNFVGFQMLSSGAPFTLQNGSITLIQIIL